MIYRLFLIIILSLLSINSISQDMNIGYNYLETGKYKNAVVFFDSILKEYPSNKTAKLCYGRAIGLNGDAKAATIVFSELLTNYPNDFEVQLNYAESLLWGKEYVSAKLYYSKLLQINDQSFEANLGYASSLFQLKEYDSSLLNIDKALAIKENNPNALISKKYIQLELANELMNKEKYLEAQTLLNNNLSFFENDKETLYKIVDLKMRQNQYKAAISGYEKIIQTTNDSIKGLNGMSLAYHLKGKNKKALKISQIVYQMANKSKKEKEIRQATSRYIEALIWNQKYKKASKAIEKLLVSSSEKNWLLLLRANLNMYKGEFQKSISDYNKVLSSDSSSFNANFGKANALYAYEKFDEAHKAALLTLVYHKGQKDVLNFIEKINIKFIPSVQNKTAFSVDLGSNNSISNKTILTFPLSTKLSLLGDLNYRNTNNTIIKSKASSTNLMGGFTYQIKSYSLLKVKIGSAFTNSDIKNFSNISSDISFKTRPFTLHSLELGSMRKFEDFNTDLIEKGIVHNHFYLNYNINTHFNFGWFTQYYFTLQSDNNVRNLLFTSLYYNLLKKPLLKIGVNYQNIHFKNQVPTIYFSPNKFYAIEGFFDLLKHENSINNKGLFYGLAAATGMQFIEENDPQFTYRVNAKIGYKINNRSLVNIYGSHSNIASSTAAGFTITEVGFRFIFHFGKKPVFNYKTIF